MSAIFWGARVFQQDISGWNTTKVVNCANFSSDLNTEYFPTMGTCFGGN